MKHFLLLSKIFLLVTTNAAICFSAFSSDLTVQLIPSNYNGYNITCFGGKDGNIHVSVSNGDSPYSYKWSTNETTESIDGLASGYYHVEVTDANGRTGT